MKRKDLSYELLLENLSRMQEEKAVLQAKFDALLAQQSSMEESYKAELTAVRAQNTSLHQTIETMRLTMEEQLRLIKTLSE